MGGDGMSRDGIGREEVTRDETSRVPTAYYAPTGYSPPYRRVGRLKPLPKKLWKAGWGGVERD